MHCQIISQAIRIAERWEIQSRCIRTSCGQEWSMAYLRLFITTVAAAPFNTLDTRAFLQDCDQNTNKTILLHTHRIVTLLSGSSASSCVLSFVLSSNNPRRCSTTHGLVCWTTHLSRRHKTGGHTVHRAALAIKCNHSNHTYWQLPRTVHRRRKSISDYSRADADERRLDDDQKAT